MNPDDFHTACHGHIVSSRQPPGRSDWPNISRAGPSTTPTSALGRCAASATNGRRGKAGANQAESRQIKVRVLAALQGSPRAGPMQSEEFRAKKKQPI
ncbi:MAG: hypothetical protein ABJF10_28795 [Chthoniobacter sp.]|uniref:hypothetical protein n=1 Tax=Chthoniobacter sp. TaxID=2510640 RepID=UPI0032AD6DF5